jgi:hypothetical protein
MKNEFVPYNIAKKLKDMGFDEPCISYYPDKDENIHYVTDGHNNVGVRSNSQFGIACSAPLWQQVTRWLRDERKINVYVDFFMNVKKWGSYSYSQNLNGEQYAMERSMEKFIKMIKYDTYEEALESEITNIINHWKTDEKES